MDDAAENLARRVDLRSAAMADATLMAPALLGLIHNAALLLALALVLDLFIRGAGDRGSVSARLRAGGLIGAIGAAIMLAPWPLVPGLVFDTRSVLLAVSGLFSVPCRPWWPWR